MAGRFGPRRLVRPDLEQAAQLFRRLLLIGRHLAHGVAETVKIANRVARYIGLGEAFGLPLGERHILCQFTGLGIARKGDLLEGFACNVCVDEGVEGGSADRQRHDRYRKQDQ